MGEIRTDPRGSSKRQWARLDEFEGDGYECVFTSAELGDGTVVEAYIYALKGNSSAQSPTGVS